MLTFMVGLGRDREVQVFWLDLGNNPFSYLSVVFHTVREGVFESVFAGCFILPNAKPACRALPFAIGDRSSRRLGRAQGRDPQLRSCNGHRRRT